MGKWHNASNVIGCSFLSKFLLDPFLHTLLQRFRVFRRIATIMPQLAKDTFGPATTFKSYLNQTGWSLDVDGTLDGPDCL